MTDVNAKTRQQAWDYGFANTGPTGREGCPYERGTIFYDDWHDGRMAAEAKEQNQ